MVAVTGNMAQRSKTFIAAFHRRDTMRKQRQSPTAADAVSYRRPVVKNRRRNRSPRTSDAHRRQQAEEDKCTAGTPICSRERNVTEYIRVACHVAAHA